MPNLVIRPRMVTMRMVKAGSVSGLFSGWYGEGMIMNGLAAEKNERTARRKRGRQRISPPAIGDRVSIGLRVSAVTKERLERGANESGRSLSQETELRIEIGFQCERLAIVAERYIVPQARRFASSADIDELPIDRNYLIRRDVDREWRPARHFMRGSWIILGMWAAYMSRDLECALIAGPLPAPMCDEIIA